MARLPQPGGDEGNWGTVLNDFLSVEHNANGTLKNVARQADLNGKADQADLEAHISNPSAAHTASAISFSPTGSISATSVQAAIAEVASETGGATSLDGLSDVAVTTPTTGHTLIYSGSRFTNRADNVVNVRDFGATGDGSTDDTAAIQAAITAAAGRMVYFPKPSVAYRLTDDLTINASLSIKGDKALLRRTGSNSGGLLISSTSHVAVEGLHFEGDYTSGSISGDGAIEILNTTHVTVRNCSFKNLRGIAIEIENGKDIEVRHNHFETMSGSGVRLNETSGAGRVNTRIWIENNTFLDCQKSDTWGQGAIQTHDGGATHNKVWIQHNTLDTCRVAIGLDLVEDAVVHSNHIRNCVGEGIAMSGNRIDVTANDIHNTGAAGILVWVHANFSDIRIMHNRASGAPQGVGIVFGADDAVLSRTLISLNQLSNNNRGIQSYLDGASSGYRYENVIASLNDLSGSTAESNNTVPGTDGSYIGFYNNLTGDTSGVTSLSSNGLFNDMQFIGGAENVQSVEKQLILSHRDSESINQPSELQVLGSFTPDNPTSKTAGVGMRKAGAYANNINLVLYAYGSGAMAEAITLSNTTTRVHGNLRHLGTNVGFFGAEPVARPSALTASDATAINSGDAGTDDVIENLRTRVQELESKLQDLGLLS